MKNRINEIFRRHGPAYLKQFKDRILPSHRRAIRDIAECRTPGMGGHKEECEHCGAIEYIYHACKNRSCPQCQTRDAEKWVEAREAELLPVMYFHVVFTVPQEIRDIICSRQKELLACLMKAAAQALLKLAEDPKYVGGKAGVSAVLHTWSGALIYHPHVHCLVPGGGVAEDNHTWHESRGNYLVPVKALAKIFKAKFMDMAEKALPDISFPTTARQKEWVVYSKPTVQGSQKVLEYLGRYVFRSAITGSRILALDDETVTFRYKKTDSKKKKVNWRTMRLPIFEFMRRFLQHVLPRGFHKVRYYGILSPANRPVLKGLQILLQKPGEDEELSETSTEETATGGPMKMRPCPHCRQGYFIRGPDIPRAPSVFSSRAPPLKEMSCYEI